MIYVTYLAVVIGIVVLMFIAVVAGILSFRTLDINYVFGRILGHYMFTVIGIKFRIEGLENLPCDEPCVILGNHQNGVDVAVYGASVPKGTRAIGKRELVFIPFLGWAFWLAGNPLVNRKKNRKAVGVMQEAAKMMREQGRSILILPEGTRNFLGEEAFLPFKKGAFYLAVQTQAPIVPSVVSPLHRVISWDLKTANGGPVVHRYLPPISTKGKTDKDIPDLLKQARKVMLVEYAKLDQELWS